MKLKFDKMDYQTDAVESIVDVFEGQSMRVSNFSVSMGEIIGQQTTALGIGNKLELSDAELLDNVQTIQVRNHLPKSKDIQDRNFTIEMETGTGKTYVYIQTIYELNKRYGFSKFIIVVPSVAIREGVHKTFEMTDEHFKELYPGQSCNYFIYDSAKLEYVRDFATSTNIEVMIINIDAFRKSFDDPAKETKANLIHRERDTMNGQKPIQFIQETNPIVIIDEPQSVDNTDKSKEAIASLNPLCKLRYSATHREQYNLMYKLDPVDAYEQELVKKIEVLSVRSDDDFNDPYIKLLNVSNKSGYKATVEMDVLKKNGTVKREKKQVDPNSKNGLYLLSGERDVYKGYVIAGIDCNPNNESVEFESGKLLYVGDVIGGLDDATLKRYQIRETIRTHLDRELKLVHQGIKVLTLFFIDKVENYRIYLEAGEWQRGKYAVMFEEEYENLIRLPKYKTLFKEDAYISNQQAGEVHDGYFARDGKGNFKDTRVTKAGKVSITKADESTFNLIMKEKEKLLSFSTPLRFIFSHSALKEGWDNPNVFQICTLVETQDTLTKRQKIGRGLRLPVNQDGERQYDENINVLTVVANESYEDFAATLQTEMEEETGIRFGYLEEHSFSLILDGNKAEIGYEVSEEIFGYLKEQKYINKHGKVEEKLKEALVENTFTVPQQYKTIQTEIETEIRRVIRKLPVFDKRNQVDITLNKQILLSPEFEQLWDQIKYKTTYSVAMNTEKLIEESIKEIGNLPRVRSRRIQRDNAYVDINRSGVTAESQSMRVEEVLEEKRQLPDVLQYLQEQTNLKRKTLVEILVGCNRLDDFKKNPQAFMEEVMKVINRAKRNLIMDGIKYERIGDQAYFRQSLFEDKELIGYMKANAVEVSNEKSVYNYVRYDSEIEKEFAERLNHDEDVKLFVKLPSAFKIDTPLGNYNPDWAVLIDKDEVEKLYFVVETKGSTDRDQLRFVEHEKIRCGEKHFEALETEAEYKLASDFREIKERVY